MHQAREHSIVFPPLQRPGYLASVLRWSRCGYSQTEVVDEVMEVVSGRSHSTSLYVYLCTFIVYSSTCSTAAVDSSETFRNYWLLNECASAIQ